MDLIFNYDRLPKYVVKGSSSGLLKNVDQNMHKVNKIIDIVNGLFSFLSILQFSDIRVSNYAFKRFKGNYFKYYLFCVIYYFIFIKNTNHPSDYVKSFFKLLGSSLKLFNFGTRSSSLKKNKRKKNKRNKRRVSLKKKLESEKSKVSAFDRGVSSKNELNSVHSKVINTITNKLKKKSIKNHQSKSYLKRLEKRRLSSLNLLLGFFHGHLVLDEYGFNNIDMSCSIKGVKFSRDDFLKAFKRYIDKRDSTHIEKTVLSINYYFPKYFSDITDIMSSYNSLHNKTFNSYVNKNKNKNEFYTSDSSYDTDY
jgi:hypothetical protein